MTTNEEKDKKNVKISKKHHDSLKNYCDKNGMKMYKVLEKWIDEFCKTKKDIYGDD
jgi:coproporphyrinogen III oxidase